MQKKRIMVVVFPVIVLVLMVVNSAAAAFGMSPAMILAATGTPNYLPIIWKAIVLTPTATATATATVATATATATATTQVSPTATATATSTPAPSLLYIQEIKVTGDLDTEYVVITNNLAATVNLEDWSISDTDGNSYSFSSLIIPPGESIRLWSKDAENDGRNLFWGFTGGAPVWDEDGECAYLRNGQNRLIDEYCY